MTLAEKKAVIIEFLGRCNRYADGKLAEYRGALPGASAWTAMEIEDKLNHWTAYRAFNAFTIEELASTELDHWFE
jgi:hypothetical protein